MIWAYFLMDRELKILYILLDNVGIIMENDIGDN
jgi:hypothetical protein